MNGGQQLGPVEAVVIAALVAPSGYAVQGVDLCVPTDAYLDRWIPARELARHARLPERQCRHHLAHLFLMDFAERTDLRELVEAMPAGANLHLPRWGSLDEPIYRWCADVDPTTLYAGVEAVADRA